MTDPITVVGGSVATTAFLERLRELGVKDPVTVLDSDPDAPYDRPPLSKRYLLSADHADIAVDWSGLGATLVRATATGVDVAQHRLHVRHRDGDDGALTFGRLVIACGAVPVHLPSVPRGVRVLRSAADARRLHSECGDGARIAILGAGAIGVELASFLTELGCQVTLLDRASGPLERLLGGHLGAEVTAWLTRAGVGCRWNEAIQRVARTEADWTIELGSGESLHADAVVSAVGARPAVEWLAGSLLLSEGALLVNEDARVVQGGVPVPNIFAIGDVASRRGRGGAIIRSESWTAAREQGARLAEHFAGVEHEATPPPYFWTEVVGNTVQIVGRLRPGAVVELKVEDVERGSALYRVPHDDGDAWIGVNAQPRIARLLMGVA